MRERRSFPSKPWKPFGPALYSYLHSILVRGAWARPALTRTMTILYSTRHAHVRESNQSHAIYPNGWQQWHAMSCTASRRRHSCDAQPTVNHLRDRSSAAIDHVHTTSRAARTPQSDTDRAATWRLPPGCPSVSILRNLCISCMISAFACVS